MLDPEKIKNSKWIALLPPSEHPWKLLEYNGYVFAASPGRPPLVLYEDGWKEIPIAEADFTTEAGKLFVSGIQQAARMQKGVLRMANKFPVPSGPISSRPQKKRR